jgi:hypothetical protein
VALTPCRVHQQQEATTGTACAHWVPTHAVKSTVSSCHCRWHLADAATSNQKKQMSWSTSTGCMLHGVQVATKAAAVVSEMHCSAGCAMSLHNQGALLRLVIYSCD